MPRLYDFYEKDDHDRRLYAAMQIEQEESQVAIRFGSADAPKAKVACILIDGKLHIDLFDLTDRHTFNVCGAEADRSLTIDAGHDGAADEPEGGMDVLDHPETERLGARSDLVVLNS